MPFKKSSKIFDLIAFLQMGLMTIISVVIPTFNREVLIQRALHSVIKQQNVKTEIIVVDDGSTDNTEQVVREKFKSVKYLRK